MLLTTECVLSKKWIARRLNDFYDILAEIKTAARNAGIPQEPATSVNKASNASEARLFKKKQEIIYKRLEKSLTETLQTFAQPHWLVLLLVENCRDYKSSKYNSVPCLIVKTFESWLAKRPAAAAAMVVVKPGQLDDEIRMAAFELATRHHLILIETVARCYQLTESNGFLVDRLKQKLRLLDYKDKAILIGSLMMHDHFDTEEVTAFLFQFLAPSPVQSNRMINSLFFYFADSFCFIF